MQTTLFLDLKFLAGVGFAILFFICAVLSGISLALGFGLRRGAHHQALKRLIELEEKETGQSSRPFGQ